MSGPKFVVDSRASSKKFVSEILITNVINNGFVFVVVKQTPTILERIIKSPIYLTKCGSSLLYSVSDPLHIMFGVKLLARMEAWHKPIFHGLIIKKNSESMLIKLCAESDASVCSVEKEFGQNAYCYIDPVDDLLEFYGDELIIKSIVTGII